MILLRISHFVLLCLFTLVPFYSVHASNDLGDRFSGSILLQVEQNGEAWWVNPLDTSRHFLYRPENAYQLMRQEGIGITNTDLDKIPIGFYQVSGSDIDGDGLVDNFEKAIRSNPYFTDTDNDGYTDKEEAIAGFKVNGEGAMPHDSSFTQNHLGKIFLQVESYGEAWWVNPDDGKRYYLGGVVDAFNLMRFYGKGISDVDIETIHMTDTRLECDSIRCAIDATNTGVQSDGFFELEFFDNLKFAYSTTLSPNASAIYTELESFDEDAFRQIFSEIFGPEVVDEMINIYLYGDISSQVACSFAKQDELIGYMEKLEDNTLSSEPACLVVESIY